MIFIGKYFCHSILVEVTARIVSVKLYNDTNVSPQLFAPHKLCAEYEVILYSV